MISKIFISSSFHMGFLLNPSNAASAQFELPLVLVVAGADADVEGGARGRFCADVVGSVARWLFDVDAVAAFAGVVFVVP